MAFLEAWARSARVRGIFLSLALAVCFARPQSPPGQVAPGQDTGGNSKTEQKSPPAQSAAPAPAQNPATPPEPIEFESRGMEYEALTKSGITVMFAALPPHIKDYNIVQVTITNGSLVSWTVKPSDFSFVRQDGVLLQPVSADEVVASLLRKASAADVIKLQLLYEDSIYALTNFRSTNGYEQRREAAMAQFVNRGLKAAVAASAITLVPTKLKPGDSTDGAVFFENRTKEKSIGPGRLITHTCGETFEFEIYPEYKPR
ncbi:MAG: hypothetical protein WB992_10245 [Bryobacteraceae bacterium]